jgi:nicotinate phosphoribosyltransferase
LTDTIGTDMFLKDFDKKFATLFSGVRHDSGNPIEWGNKMIKHYESLGIDPMTKTLLFSDSLTAETAALIAQTFEGRAKTAFGIGTFISNPSPIKLNIVMKVVECNGLPVAKLSDTPGKGMCEDQEYIKYLNDAIEWRKKKGK